MESESLPVLSIVIPVHNQLQYTRNCIKSILQFPPEAPFEILIIDDASTDATQDFLNEISLDDQRVVAIRNNQNLGFARSNNRGVSAARGKYVLLLNNDTEVLPGWFPPLFCLLEQNTDIGIVGPKLCFPDGTIQHCGKIWMDTKHPLAQPHHIYYRTKADAPHVNKSREYSMLTGACLLVRRDEFLSLGPFDETYENGWEDDDLCYAFHAAGKKVIYCAESAIIHHQSKTLNTKIKEAEQLLADHRLNASHTAQRTAEEQSARQITEKELISDLERQLMGVRERFLCNRERFFSKWEQLVTRDDFRYYKEDGLPFVSIVIPTFNELDKTRDCIRSIRKNTPELHEIIFVDNGSTDGTVAWLRELCNVNDAYTLIENSENRGFAAVSNQGIEAAYGEYILLLNNHVVVPSEWLSGLLECLFLTEDAGIVGPVTNSTEVIQPAPNTDQITLSQTEIFAAEFRRRYRHRRSPCRWITGDCMLFRKAIIEEIGLLDENFGTEQYADKDFCLRAALAGYSSIIAGDVFVLARKRPSCKESYLDLLALSANPSGFFQKKWSRPVTDEREGKRIITLKTLEKAESLFQRGDHDGMIEAILQEGIRQIPGENRFYLALAGYLLDLGRHKDAFDVLAELPESCTQEARLVLTGRALAGMGRLEEALVQGEAALRRNACSARAFHLMGLIAASQGQPDRAETYWKKALEYDPGYGVPYCELGFLELNDSSKDAALDLLERGFLLSPLAAETVLRYHMAASAAGNFERAEKRFSEMHRLYPQHRTIHFLFIDLLIRQGKAAEALTEIEEACVVFGSSDGMLAAGLELRRSIGPMSIPVEKHDSGTSISLCMIIKDEQDNLPRCLKSLKPVVDEIILVDTGSSDRSREIGEMFGARLFEFPWNGDFSAARNVSLEHAQGNWILVMDADEVLSAMDYLRFRTLVADSPSAGAGYDIVTRNYRTSISFEKWRANDGMYPADEAGAGWTPSNKVRLFPNRPEVRFENPVHEMVDATLVASHIPILHTDIPVHHYGCLDKARQQRKGEEYYRLGRKKLEQSGGNDFRALCELAVQAGGIGRYQQAVELWERVLAINPSYPLALFNMGYALLQLGRFDDARTASKKALELDSQLYEAVNNFAICEICIGSTAEAIRVLESSLKKRPNDTNTLVTLAVARLCAGENRDGRDTFQRLTDSNVEYADFINEATKKFIEAGKTDYARTLLETATLLSSGNEETGRLFREFGGTT